MSYEDDIKPITYMKTNSADLVKKVTSRRKPVFISQNGEPRVVVQGLEDYREQQNLILALRMIALGEKEIANNEIIEQTKLFSFLDRKYRG